MGSVNVSLREDVYRDLKRFKGDDESFSDAVERLLSAGPGEHPLYDLVGLLDEDEAESMRARMATFRAELDEDMDRYQ